MKKEKIDVPSYRAFEPKKRVTIHKDVRFHPDLTFGEKMFLAEVCSMNKKTCPFSSTLLKDEFKVSHQTIINWVKKLVRMGYLEIIVDLENDLCSKFIKATSKVTQ
jgi:DNA-binding MarR family transcriptional regulator